MPDSLRLTIQANLRNPDVPFWIDRKHEADTMLAGFVHASDEPNANSAWYLKAVSNVFEAYCRCFLLMQGKSFYEAWCLFERAEIEIADLRRNPIYEGAEFELDLMTERISAFQALFPYKVFFSPEMIVGRRECGICGTVRTPWSDCGHEIGKVYMGKICTCIAKEVELLSISMVTDPVQKYSVGFATNEQGDHVDNHDYSVVAFVVDRLVSPFDGWSSKMMHAYHPHSRYSDLSDEDLCPCESGRVYSDCCRKKPGVVRPHLQFFFDVPPPDHLPQFELPAVRR